MKKFKMYQEMISYVKNLAEVTIEGVQYEIRGIPDSQFKNAEIPSISKETIKNGKQHSAQLSKKEFQALTEYFKKELSKAHPWEGEETTYYEDICSSLKSRNFDRFAVEEQLVCGLQAAGLFYAQK